MYNVSIYGFELMPKYYTTVSYINSKDIFEQ